MSEPFDPAGLEIVEPTILPCRLPKSARHCWRNGGDYVCSSCLHEAALESEYIKAFGWVPPSLSDPPPPTPAVLSGAETLRKLPAPSKNLDHQAG